MNVSIRSSSMRLNRRSGETCEKGGEEREEEEGEEEEGVGDGVEEEEEEGVCVCEDENCARMAFRLCREGGDTPTETKRGRSCEGKRGSSARRRKRRRDT